VPTGRELLALIAEAGGNVQRAAELLQRLMASWPEDQALRREIFQCEHEGDRLTHDIIHTLHRSTVTPLDRNDLFSLASAIDDIVDYTEEAADFLDLYRIEAPMAQAQQLAGVLRDAARQVAQALGRLDRLDELNVYVVEVKRLENEGDRITREALASLFAGGIDPMAVIRWKDVFERLEQGIDACERVAHILEGIVVRQI
jgi:predicted phosphate transport protein (TIGR00153 family)